MRAPLRMGLLWAMWLLTGVYVAALAVHSLGWGRPWAAGSTLPSTDGWLS
jgi:hypothetical protein